MDNKIITISQLFTNKHDLAKMFSCGIKIMLTLILRLVSALLLLNTHTHTEFSGVLE